MKTNWNELTIADLMRLKEISSLQLATEDEKNIKAASIVTEMTYDEMIQLPLSKVRSIMDAAGFLLQEPKPIKAKRHYTINGREYTLLKNEMEMLTSQYVDFQAIQEDGFEKRPAELLSIMLVPKGHNYNDGYDKDQVIEDMYALGVEEALGIVDFFIKRFVRLIAWTRMYLKLRIRLLRLRARGKKKEFYKATELQLGLVLDELNSMYGLIAQKR